MNLAHLTLIVGLAAMAGAAAGGEPAEPPRKAQSAPLRLLTVHPTNPRYFTDGSGRAVYLTGSHTWPILQDWGLQNPPEPFDWIGFLDMMQKYRHNFMRLWQWEQPAFPEWRDPDKTRRITPMPFARTGPGEAWDGKPKFDLTKFDEAYFERLRAGVAAAQERGIYVGVIFFVPTARRSANWPGHPFHKDNNINGIDGDANHDGRGEEVHILAVPEVTRIQETYVRKVIDTINGFDNVLYEIGNEMSFSSNGFQYHMIRYIREYEKTLPKQHPIGMTALADAPPGCMDAMLNSPADWISPENERVSADGRETKFRYDRNPPAADGTKVMLTDTDHIYGVGGDDVWVWKTFCRGMNPIYMDPVGHGDHILFVERNKEAYVPRARAAMGHTRELADRIDLAAMTPQGDLASTGYCLAARGSEYVVLQPRSGPFSLDLSAASGEFEAEWFSLDKTHWQPGPPVRGGSVVQFDPPTGGRAVLHLVKP